MMESYQFLPLEWKIPLICFSILPNLTGGTKKETQLIMTNIADGR